MRNSSPRPTATRIGARSAMRDDRPGCSITDFAASDSFRRSDRSGQCNGGEQDGAKSGRGDAKQMVDVEHVRSPDDRFGVIHVGVA